MPSAVDKTLLTIATLTSLAVGLLLARWLGWFG